jgi:hypothetical protein
MNANSIGSVQSIDGVVVKFLAAEFEGGTSSPAGDLPRHRVVVEWFHPELCQTQLRQRPDGAFDFHATVGQRISRWVDGIFDLGKAVVPQGIWP